LFILLHFCIIYIFDWSPFEWRLSEQLYLVIKNHPFFTIMREENAVLQFLIICQMSLLHSSHQESFCLLCKTNGVRWQLFIGVLFLENLNVAENVTFIRKMRVP